MALFGQKTTKPTGMTSLGFPGLTSQSVSGFFGPFGPKNPKRTGMTSLGCFPGLSSHSVPGFFGCPRRENLEMDWDDNPGLPRLVIPVRFRFFGSFWQKARKRSGMTSLGFPVLSSQSISGLFGPVRPKNTETDWDNKPGLPRVVIPVRFGFLWPLSARKPKTDWDYKPGLPRVVIPIHFGLFMPFSARKTCNRLG